MRIHILFSILLILIIKESISDETEEIYDLRRYERITVNASETLIIFDSSEFKKDEEIYFKITADKFKDDYIYYKFFDDFDIMTTTDVLTYEPVEYSKTDKEYSNGEVISQTNYYTIKKSERDLGSLEGKYLAIIFNCEGNVTIENTKENEGDTTWIVIVCVLVVVAIVAAICIYCYCKRKKKAAENGNTNDAYINNNNQNYNTNTGNNVNVYSNNYNNNNNNYNNINKNYMNNNYMNNNYNA